MPFVHNRVRSFSDIPSLSRFLCLLGLNDEWMPQYYHNADYSLMSDTFQECRRLVIVLVSDSLQQQGFTYTHDPCGYAYVCMHRTNSEWRSKDVDPTCIITAYSCYLLTELSNSNGPTEIMVRPFRYP